MTTNLIPGSEISSLYAFGSAIYLFDKTCHFVPKQGTKHFVPVSCKRLQKFHTGLSSSRSHVNTPLVTSRHFSIYTEHFRSHFLLSILEDRRRLADEMAFRNLNKRYKKGKYEHRSTLPPRQTFALPWVPEVR